MSIDILSLFKQADSTPERSYSLTGRLFLSKSGWVLLSVPNAIGRGAFKAINEPGIELPVDEDEGQYNAHISILRPEEVEQIGGPGRISERGKEFSYSLGNIREFEPSGWKEMERCWAIEVHSPDLEKLRKSYGLSPIPGDGKLKYHITVAVRRRKVLGNNNIVKSPDTAETAGRVRSDMYLTDKPGVHLVKLSADEEYSTKIAGMDSNVLGIMKMLAEPQVRAWGQARGMRFGEFTPTRNIADTDYDRNFNAQLSQIMQGGTERGDGVKRFVKGLHTMFGREWTPEMEAQSATLQKDFGKIAPYLMRYAPDIYDKLHGGHGSVATLAAAIANTNKYNNMDAPTAVAQAEQLFQRLYADPMLHRGYTATEIGQIYHEASKRGLIRRNARPQDVLEDLTPIIGANSAVRDMIGHEGQRTTVPQAFQAIDALLPQYGTGTNWKSLEKRIRTDDQMARRGGIMNQALTRANVNLQSTGQSLEGLGQQHQTLMENAKKSPMMKLLTATRRAVDKGLINANSPAAMYLRQVESGRAQPITERGLQQLMARSGLRPRIMMGLLGQGDYNVSKYYTPELGLGVRMMQGANPQLQAYLSRYRGNSKEQQVLREGAQNQYAINRGYKNWANYQALHGDPVKQMPNVLADAGREAERFRGSSSMGWKDPTRRLMDVIMDSDGDQSLTALGAGFMGGIPRDEQVAPPPEAAPSVFSELTAQRPAPRPAPPSPYAPATTEAYSASPPKAPSPVMPVAAPPRFDSTAPTLASATETATPSFTASAPQPFELKAPQTAVASAPVVPNAQPPTFEAEVPVAPKFASVRELFNRPFVEKAAARQPLGIPDRNDYGDLSKLQPEQIIDLIIQRHKANRAGEHYDYRLGTPDTGLYSWSMKPTELPAPGEKRFVRQQPMHTHQYGNFQGKIHGSGYGAGTVKREQRSRLLVTSAAPDKIEYTIASSGTPERFVLLRPQGWQDRDWLLMNVTPTAAAPYDKVHYKKVPAEAVEPFLDQMQQGTSVQAKVDGAATLVKLMRSGAEVMSYRTSKKNDRPIMYTERVFGGRPKFPIPPEYAGSVLKGELYGTQEPEENAHVVDTGSNNGVDGDTSASSVRDLRPDSGSDPVTQVAVEAGGLDSNVVSPQGEDASRPVRHGGRPGGVIPPQALGGILNSTIENSLKTQQEKGIKLHDMLYDIQQVGKRRLDPNQVPYAERRKILQDLMQHLPPDTFNLAEEETTPAGAKQLWRDVVEGKHPLTNEGIVGHPPTGVPWKAKNLEDADVHITGIFPGEGKYSNVGAGGFEYALEPNGPAVGRVGSGLSDELRQQLWNDQDAYIGRKARIRSQEQLPSGAYRAPSLLSLHEDY